MSQKEGIKISLESFDHSVLTKSMNEILSTVRRTGASVVGPIPMPKKIKKFTVIKGPHVDKDSREQFEIRSFKMLLIIVPAPQTVDALMKLSLSAGVSIKISINGNTEN
jgi:small subunit ribosomal protein S10